MLSALSVGARGWARQLRRHAAGRTARQRPRAVVRLCSAGWGFPTPQPRGPMLSSGDVACFSSSTADTSNTASAAAAAAATTTTTVPVTVLSGFLGAGKTTLLNNILRDEGNHGKRIAVLVNDMAEVNIDAELVRNSDGAATHGTELVQLQNGCICCTLRDDLVLELAGLARQGGIDHIVVESTGVSEPLPVAQTFSAPIHTAAPEEATTAATAAAAAPELPAALAGLRSLNDVVHLHSLVTVVDSSTFLAHLESLENLADLGMSTGRDDARPLAFLLAEQVQFANLILVNKTDLVTPREASRVERLLRHLNPYADIRQTRDSAVDVPVLLASRTYDEAAFAALPEWAEELAKRDTAAGHQSEADEYGIGHFTLRVLGRPFHAERWHAALHKRGLLDGVLRAKGCFWTTAEPDTRVDLSLVGKTVSLIVNTTWAQAGINMLTRRGVQLRNVRSDDAHAAALQGAVGRLTARAAALQEQSLWHPVTEDRRVELVFIGDRDVMDEARLRAEVEAALLTKEELEEFLQGAFGGEGAAAADAEKGQANPFATVPRCLVL